jgi:histone-binding protein RBBP4
LWFQEYKTWKKNSPALYDYISTTALEWPSLSIDWLPDVEVLVLSLRVQIFILTRFFNILILRDKGKPYTVHRLVVGTDTNNEEQNFLRIYRVIVPKFIDEDEETGLNSDNYDQDKRGQSCPACLKARRINLRLLNYHLIELRSHTIPSSIPTRLSPIQNIPHPSCVNRARHMPHNPDLIATKCGDASGRVLIFDRTKHGDYEDDKALQEELSKLGGKGGRWEIELKGCQSEGFPISWNPTKEGEGHFLSGGEDGRILHW